MKPFNPGKRVLVFTDASKEGGLGYILEKEEGAWNKENCKFKPEIKEKTGEPKLFMVTCGSTILTLAQRNYYIIELELSTIMYTFLNAKHWLIGTPSIEGFPDHSPLKHISDFF